jgi:hypothetical protein
MGGVGKTFTKTFKAIDPIYQVHKVAGKAGFKSPIYLMGEEKRGFGRAIELSGDPIQRAIRGKIRDWAMDSGLAKSAPPKYTSMPKVNVPQFQAPNNSALMNNFLAQQQQGNQASVMQKADALAAANAAQQSNIAANVVQAGTPQLGFRAPIKTSFTPANNFSSPNLTGLTFGGK